MVSLEKPKAKARGIARKDPRIFGVGQGLWWGGFTPICLTHQMVEVEERLAARSLIQRFLIGSTFVANYRKA